MGRTTIREQMRVEKHERKTIKHQKRDQLEAAKADLFADLDQVNEMDQKLVGMGRVGLAILRLTTPTTTGSSSGRRRS